MPNHPDFHEIVFEAMPSPIFVIDSDLSIIDFNLAAARVAEPVVFEMFRPRSGDLLGCIHAEAEGCGNSPACRTCVVAASIREAMEGRVVCRKAARVHVRKGDEIRETELLVTTASFEDVGQRLALMVLEDVGELLTAHRAAKVENAGCAWKACGD